MQNLGGQTKSIMVFSQVAYIRGAVPLFIVRHVRKQCKIWVQIRIYVAVVVGE